MFSPPLAVVALLSPPPLPLARVAQLSKTNRCGLPPPNVKVGALLFSKKKDGGDGGDDALLLLPPMTRVPPNR
jgi:hypothetical protein